MHILFASLPFIVPFCFAIVGALDYLYIKHHVFIERQVVKYCIKKLDAQIINHRHKTKVQYHSCRIWIGSDYTDSHPRTISSDIIFPQFNSKEEIFEQIFTQLKKWKIEIVSKSSCTLHIKKNKHVFVISIISVRNYKSFNNCYRLIFTWKQPQRPLSPV